MIDLIYFDNAATTKPKQEVIDSMLPYFSEDWFNPSSLYKPATKIKKDIEQARKVVADFLNVKSDEIFFTSGGSESNCWAIQGFIKQSVSKGNQPIIITTPIEHKSIIECVEDIAPEFAFVEVDDKGSVCKDSLKSLLNYYKGINGFDVLVSIQTANNEIGTIQDIEELAKLTHEYNGVFHTDAVQAFGHILIDCKKSNIDMLSASGHKIGCPKGIGILYKRTEVEIKPIIYGSQMDGIRGGTENVPYIIGFAKAVELCSIDDGIYKQNLKLQFLHDTFMLKLHQIFNNDVKLNGEAVKRLPNNINITFDYSLTGESLIYMLDLCGICISAGSACNSHLNKPSHVLQAIGKSDEEASKTIRITLPDDTNVEMIKEFLKELHKQIMLLIS